MGKGKGRGDEHVCRVNYLFQAGEMVAKSAPQLSQFYGNVLTVITEKTTPKKDFTMKRLMCKKCLSILNVGANATYRLRKNKKHKGTPNIIITCLFCGEIKRLPTRRGFKIKAEVEGTIIGDNSVQNIDTNKIKPKTSEEEPTNGQNPASEDDPSPPLEKIQKMEI